MNPDFFPSVFHKGSDGCVTAAINASDEDIILRDTKYNIYC
jgi:hypothetical protein